MTYQENLRKTAEEIARYTHPNGWDSGFTETGLIQRYIPAAEYCLKKQAEAYSVAYNKAMQDNFSIGWDGQDKIDRHLKQLGLIP